MFGPLGATQPVNLTLYTDAFIVRGVVETRQRRVTDILNLTEEPFLVLRDVTVDEFGSRGQTTRSDFAQVNLSSVLFAVADTPVEPAPELRTPKTPEQALISVPPFKVIGSIHLMPGRDLAEALGELMARFIPVTDAVYWSDAVGEGRQTAQLVAFNHARAQILAPHQEVDPWAGMPQGGGSAPPDAPGGGW